MALALLLVLWPAPLARAQLGDAQAGAETLRRRRCILCHSIRGVGGYLAPDLGRRSTRRFTPSGLAAMMWNHGPAMWEAMARRKFPVPRLSPREVSDLYAYFYSLRYFDPPGDAARGKDVFVKKSCFRCHALAGAPGALASAIGPPVSKWPSLGDPLLWTQNMWNHGAGMAEELRQKGIDWPRFSVQEMVDLLVYLQNLPAGQPPEPTLSLGRVSAGEDVFKRRHCSSCHTLGVDSDEKINLLEGSRPKTTLTELAVSMWNHRPDMVRRARKLGMEMESFQGEEMAELVAYLFAQHYFETEGNRRRGKRLFASKGCGSCHGRADSPAPSLRRAGRAFLPLGLASAVWRHGPAMLEEMKSRGITWPTLSGRDMDDLISYLNSP